jgi:hypothetical protein
MKLTVHSTSNKLNYSFVYSRIIAFSALYFSIYAYPLLGEASFWPMYLCLLAYTGIFLLVTFVIGAVIGIGSAVKPPVGDELAEIEKKSGGWWGFLYNAFDISMFWFMGFVWDRNGFPEMAGWMNAFVIIAILMGLEALWLRLWFHGKFN